MPATRVVDIDDATSYTSCVAVRAPDWLGARTEDEGVTWAIAELYRPWPALGPCCRHTSRHLPSVRRVPRRGSRP